MPAPSTSEARNLHREAQVLIEQAVVQQAESLASRIGQQGSTRATGVRKALRRQYTRAARRGSPPTKGARRSRSGFLTCAGRPKTATLATSSTPGGRATRRRGQRQATIRGGVGATIAERIARRHRNPREPACSAGRSARQAFVNASASLRQSTSTRGRRTPHVWLNDYRLACQLDGATTDEVIIRNLPLHLADSAWTWLEHLPASQIHNWDDLVCTFVGNFQGTYVRPGNTWDLRACT
jgi:hypothetical protein